MPLAMDPDYVIGNHHTTIIVIHGETIPATKHQKTSTISGLQNKGLQFKKIDKGNKRKSAEKIQGTEMNKANLTHQDKDMCAEGGSCKSVSGIPLAMDPGYVIVRFVCMENLEWKSRTPVSIIFNPSPYLNWTILAEPS
jgi:hypothetical protein